MPNTSDPSSFWEEARFQATCAMCESPGPFDAHHVIEKARLKRMGLPMWDTRNALRLCDPCHEKQWNRVLVVPTKKLLHQNICYLFEVLAEAGQYYLEKHYTGPDARYQLHVDGLCLTCRRTAP